MSDLSRFELDADQKHKVPCYVIVEYRNNGTRSLLPQMNQKANCAPTRSPTER